MEGDRFLISLPRNTELPNFFTVGGPNSAMGGDSLLLIIFESITGCIVNCIRKMSREHVRRIEVKKIALEAWETHMEAYFPTTVHVEVARVGIKQGRRKLWL